jgi:hypothetical protein
MIAHHKIEPARESNQKATKLSTCKNEPQSHKSQKNLNGKKQEE